VPTQNFKNHGRLDPMFHIVLALLELILIIGSIRWFIKHPDGVHGGLLLAAIILLLLMGNVRGYAVKNQDRIIRLEEQVRLRRLMPDEPGVLAALSMSQLIGLRFASDAEVPALARRAVKENLDRKAIKAAIVEWRPDEDRV